MEIENQEPSTVSDDIRASIDKLENGEGGITPTPTPAAGEPSTTTPILAPAPAAAKPAAALATPAAPATAGKVPPAPVIDPTLGTPAELKPPVSWKPAMRDRWATLPQEVKEEVLRRERDITQGLQTAADARKFHEDFTKIAAPYQQYLAAHANGNPLGAFGDYLKTATLLRTGSPVERANAVAMAIQEYAVDVTLLDTALAAVLRGQRPAAPQGQQGQRQEFKDPRVDAILAERDAEFQAQVSTELQTFADDPKNEFFHDVKGEVADWLEWAANRNQKMTIKQAYDKACLANPSVQAVIEQRKNETTAANATSRVAAARHAAGSVAPGLAPQAPANPNTGKGTMADDIAAAIDKLSTV